MATPKCLEDFEHKTLRLPHQFWTDDESKKSYGASWSTGFSLVTLRTVQPKQRGKLQCIDFTADDDQTYVITLPDLLRFWKEKKFQGVYIHTYFMSIYFFLV
jgi:hypothetical protein